MLNLKKDKTYLLACSYGPDSMALLSLLLEDNIKFEVAHVNYHLREESNSEEQGLRQYCEQKHVVCHVLDVKERIERNIEAKCRKIRYAYFAKLFEEGEYEAVLVAHQEDDLIETFLMQKDRKNLVNYYGIKEQTVINGVPVLRPLLGYTKQQLEQRCVGYQVPFSIDQTNLTRAFKRNRIRLDVVSNLTRDERNDLLREINNKNNELERIHQKIDQVSNNIKDLLELSTKEFAYYLYKQTSLINPDYHITHKCVNEVVKLMHSSKPNISLCLGKNIIIEKAYDLLIVKEKDEPLGYQFIIPEPCEMDNEFFYLDFRGDTTNRNVKSTDYPLTIRTYLPSDKYIIKDYEVPVRRLFIDWKMPLSLRKRWPIILNKDNKIIYIPRYRKDFTFDVVPNFYVK